MKISIQKLRQRFQYLLNGKCPHCGRIQKVIKQPLKTIDSTQTALRQDREKKAQEEFEENQLPHPINK